MSGSGLAPRFAVSGSLAGTGATAGFALSSPFNVTVTGTWEGSWSLERSADEGVTWANCLLPDGTPNAFVTNGAWAVPNVWERGMQYRISFTRTSGTLNWRISQ